MRVHVDGLHLSLTFAGREARLVYRLPDPSSAISRHYAELLMVLAMHVFRLAADETWSPDEVWFRHGPPPDLAVIEGKPEGLHVVDMVEGLDFQELQRLTGVPLTRLATAA